MTRMIRVTALMDPEDLPEGWADPSHPMGVSADLFEKTSLDAGPLAPYLQDVEYEAVEV